MGFPHEPTERIEALRGLVERLSAPDLTLTESKSLRDQLAGLLEPAAVPPDRGDRSWKEARPAAPTIRVAG